MPQFRQWCRQTQRPNTAPQPSAVHLGACTAAPTVRQQDVVVSVRPYMVRTCWWRDPLQCDIFDPSTRLSVGLPADIVLVVRQPAHRRSKVLLYFDNALPPRAGAGRSICKIFGHAVSFARVRTRAKITALYPSRFPSLSKITFSCPASWAHARHGRFLGSRGHSAVPFAL